MQLYFKVDVNVVNVTDMKDETGDINSHYMASKTHTFGMGFTQKNKEYFLTFPHIISIKKNGFQP